MNEYATKAALRDSDVYERFLKLIQDPLYSVQKFTAKEFRLLENAFVLHGVRLDLHCVACGRESVFKSPHLRIAYNVEVPSALLKRGEVTSFPDNAAVDNKTTVFLNGLLLHCSRDDYHAVRFVIIHHNEAISPGENLAPIVHRVLTKIGQYPTFADLQKPQFKHLNKLLDDIDRLELNKAVGLASHDSAIGAFVYLRRVFERLIEKEHQRAAEKSDWNESLYQKARMDEKVKLLEDYLPELIVENKKIYSVLSVGIHSLTDELCESVFEPVKDGIHLMLEDAHSKRQKEALKKSIGPALDSAQSLIDKALADDDKQKP